jgi:hypothetical protein
VYCGVNVRRWSRVGALSERASSWMTSRVAGITGAHATSAPLRHIFPVLTSTRAIGGAELQRVRFPVTTGDRFLRRCRATGRESVLRVGPPAASRLCLVTTIGIGRATLQRDSRNTAMMPSLRILRKYLHQ